MKVQCAGVTYAEVCVCVGVVCMAVVFEVAEAVVWYVCVGHTECVCSVCVAQCVCRDMCVCAGVY